MNIQKYLELMETKVTSVEKKGYRKEQVIETVKEMIENGEPTFVKEICAKVGIKRIQQLHSLVKATEKLEKVKVNGRTLIVVKEG